MDEKEQIYWTNIYVFGVNTIPLLQLYKID